MALLMFFLSVDLADEVELTAANGPRDKVFDWFIEPLLIMKEQIRKLELDEHEEMSLRRLVMVNRNERPEDWDEEGFPSGDQVRRAQLQALIRRYDQPNKMCLRTLSS